MVTSAALVRGGQHRLLAFGDLEHPVALQLGGSDPAELAEAARMGAAEGYDEVNLNVGCPSDRVQSGAFGAVLMRDPGLVAACCAAMIAAQPREVTVKCRIGVDEQVPEEVLPAFLEAVREAGVRRVTIHARKAWLAGLSPKENRDVPPLDYPLVHRMKMAFPDLHLSINGGIETLEQAREHLCTMDGVMIGRAAYHRPWEVLGAADAEVFGDASPFTSPFEVAEAMVPYVDAHVRSGGRAHQATRHMLGLFSGQPGARAWRRTLSEGGTDARADGRLIRSGLEAMAARAA